MEWRGVLVDRDDRSSTDQEGLIRSAISRWRVGLIDSAAANRLVDFSPDETGVIDAARPAPAGILARLRAGGSFAFRSLQPWPGAAPPRPAPYLLDTGRHPDDLDAALRTLMRRSSTGWLELGCPVLYLAFGTLTWADRDRGRHTSPLLLVPVRLVATEPGQPPMLEPAGDDPVMNPALSLELSRYRITLPRLDDMPDLILNELLGAVRSAVAAQAGWLVGESVVLACFPPMKEPAYLDLLDHEHLAAAHPAVRALAAGGHAGPGHAGPGPAPGETTGQAVAEVPPLILDADSSQRACVTAALAGQSFIMDGPPGTGKSQTIANMIGALLRAGKTVLLVSQKAAALDVVAGRLADAGLGGYLLELHSGKAARNKVACSLANALDTAPAPSPPADAEGVFGPDTQQLSVYASAVNRVRDPLGYSLHDVLAMIASLRSVPLAPAAGIAPVHLTAEALGEIRGTARALAAAWRPAAQERSFAWRGVTERRPLDDLLYQAAAALETLARVARDNHALAAVTGMTRPSHAHALSRLLDHLLAWPEGLPEEWLTSDGLDVVEAAVAQLTAMLTAVAARENQAAQAAGVPWPAIPQIRELPAAGMTSLTALNPACADVSDLTAGQITEVLREFSAAAGLLEKWHDTVSGLAATLGLRAPVTFADANDLLILASLAAEPDRPERAWLSVPRHRAATSAAQVLYEAHAVLARAEADAGVYFTPDALRHDLSGLAKRFANYHRGLGRLSPAYRADKKTAKAFTRDGVTEERAEEHLPLAAMWQHAARALAAAEASHAALLGSYYAGRATDFPRLRKALTHAATAVRYARGQDLSRAAAYICGQGTPDQVISRIVAEARQGLSAWQAALAPPPAVAPRPELLNGTIVGAAGWLRAHLAPLHSVSQFVRAVEEVVGEPVTFGQARHLAALREAASAARDDLAARDAIFEKLCGAMYAGAATDVVALREALDWARLLRTMITGGPGPLTPAQLNAAESAVPCDGLAEAADAWHEACGAVLAAFGPQRRTELSNDLDDYQAGYDLLEALFNDASGRDEWHAYQAARASLAAAGMEAAIDFCIAEGIEPAQVPKVIERVLLQEWADHQLQADPALSPLRAAGREELVARYKHLDRILTAAAAEGTVRACNARRPPAGTGESAVIYREAAKEGGHLPVAELLARTSRVTQAIKPCFLASPLAVSQHVPAGMRFDVVIFDEASQVSTADAIGSIYRAGAVILAGDDKQLPPAPMPGICGGEGRPAGSGLTSGPESVLGLARASGAFGNLTLPWHYRSQHESLIAFSNAAFYGGRLIPVPGAGQEAGIELFYGPGTYRSGTSHASLGEAARVAQRVIHHFDTRPALSLGVVTFGDAQASAIESALAKACEQRPALGRFLATGRLRGFFVKNVEAVQGDERDVVIVSLGYGPDERGHISLDSGPLRAEGGWRRLNVAITRARYRTEIVCSIRPTDIPESTSSEGLRQLRRYLNYAAGPLPAA